MGTESTHLKVPYANCDKHLYIHNHQSVCVEEHRDEHPRTMNLRNRTKHQNQATFDERSDEVMREEVRMSWSLDHHHCCCHCCCCCYVAVEVVVEEAEVGVEEMALNFLPSCYAVVTIHPLICLQSSWLEEI